MNMHVHVPSGVPLRIADLVRDVDREPRIADLTLAERLGYAKPHNVRKLINRNRPELMLHGALVERSSSFLRHGENPAARARGGRPGTMYLLNEGQALVVCALTRTPIAVRVRQDVIAVYMAHRKGGDWLPPSQQERKALHFLANHSTLIQAGEPVHMDTFAAFTSLPRRVLLAHVTDGVLDTLAAFEGDTDAEVDTDTDEGDSNVDAEDADDPDQEPWLGWTLDGQHGHGAIQDAEGEHDGREPLEGC